MAEASKAERLFRASVSAFCSLTRPSRREIAQLDDLTVPLFDLVSTDSRRYVAAALSECEHAPYGLVKRLCDGPVDVAAPLLIRSKVLSDVDLISLIGRHGRAHARAIGRRKDLNPTIATLIAALEKGGPRLAEVPKPDPAVQLEQTAAETPEAVRPLPGVSAENARRRLRALMRPAGDDTGAVVNLFAGPTSYAKLRDTALTGNAAFFQTALADALAIDYGAIRRMAGTVSHGWLLAALRALDLTGEQAFVIAAAAYPAQFAHAESIRLFLSRYQLLHRDVAVERVRTWKVDSIAAAIQKPRPAQAAAEQPALLSANDAQDLASISRSSTGA